MTPPRHYATGVTISAALLVTGLLWWHTAQFPGDEAIRPASYIGGEDIAYLTAHAWLRYALSATYSTQPPTLAWTNLPTHIANTLIPSSNTITSARLHSQLIKTSNTLKTLFYPGPPTSTHNTKYYPIRWLDDPILTNNAPLLHLHHHITNTTTSSSGHTTIEWAIPTSTVTNTVPRTLDSRLLTPTSPDHLAPHLEIELSATNLPIAHLLTSYPINHPPLTNWWHRHISTNLYLIDHLETATNLTTKPRHHHITTNTLNTLLHIATNATSAVLIAGQTPSAPWHLWTYTSHLSRTAADVYADLGILHYSTNGTDIAQMPDIVAKISSWWSTCGAVVNTPVPPSPASTLADSPLRTLANYTFNIHATQYQHLHVRSGTPNHYFTSSIEGRLLPIAGGNIKTQLLGLSCTWPPDWAFTAGLVRRIRYYAIFSNYSAATSLEPYPYILPPTDPHLYRYECQTSDILSIWFQGTDLSTGYTLSDLFATPHTFSSTPTHHNTWHPHQKPNLPATWRPHLLLDTPSPSTRPLLPSLGPTTLPFNDPWYIQKNRTTQAETYQEYPDGDYDLTDTITISSSYTHHLTLLALICIADFDFTHYPPTHPHTPPWCQQDPPPNLKRD